ncbi:hypothetical protein Tco_1574717, partial [Tanacetum coccineum]
QNVNSVRPNVNTGRANVNSVRKNVNSVRSNVNTGSFNVNTAKTKQPIHTWHMTGNKDHLDDFKECKGGSVTFGGSKGYITGKGYTWIARRIGAWIKVELKLCKS